MRWNDEVAGSTVSGGGRIFGGWGGSGRGFAEGLREGGRVGDGALSAPLFDRRVLVCATALLISYLCTEATSGL